jgi:sulfur carrier protein
VQVNEEFAEREDWESIQVKDGDKVDFLYFMGGGNGELRVKNEEL